MVPPIFLKVCRKAVGLSVLSVTVHRRPLWVRITYWASVTVSPAVEVIVISAFIPGCPPMGAVLMASACGGIVAYSAGRAAFRADDELAPGTSAVGVQNALPLVAN